MHALTAPDVADDGIDRLATETLQSSGNRGQ
jgi:hypothetical protein